MTAIPRPQPRPVRDCDLADTGLRYGIIYKIPVYEIHPQTGMILLYEKDAFGIERVVGQVPDLNRPHRGLPRIVFDYIGQTVRGVDLREAEHIDEKPWADLIAGRILVIEQGRWDKETRDRKEIAAIHVLRPRFNHDHNLGNPDRIPIYDPETRRWVQREHRWARDRAAGRPLWMPPEARTADAADRAGHQELHDIRAGIAGPEPRYPVQIIWDGLKWLATRIGRLPRWVQQMLIGGTLGVLITWGGKQWLLSLGWDRWAATLFPVIALVLLAIAARADWRRKTRKRRRRRRRR